MKNEIEFSKLSGLELLRLMMEEKIPVASIAQTMGIALKKIEKGYVLFEVKPDERHLNPLGGVHGGFAATALDSATGSAVHTMLEPGVGYGTVDLNIKMIKAILLKQGPLKCEGKVLHISKRIGIAEGRIIDHEGKLYAHATATCVIL